MQAIGNLHLTAEKREKLCRDCESLQNSAMSALKRNFQIESQGATFRDVLSIAIAVLSQNGNQADYEMFVYREGFYRGASVSLLLCTLAFVLRAFRQTSIDLGNLHGKLADYKGHKIAQAILTHPHHDHISDCGPLTANEKLHPTLITCPNDKESTDAVDWSRIKNRDGNKSLEKYKKLYAGRELPLQTIEHTSSNSMTQDLEYGLYYIKPAVCEDLHTDDNEYGNSLSVVSYIRYGKNSILLPGDVTPLAMEKILGQTEGAEKRFTVFNKKVQQEHPRWIKETFDQPSLKGRLGEHGLTVLLAPHHGLKSCYSPELYAAIKGGKPDLVAISEMQAPGEGQGEIDGRYQSESGSNGLTVKISGTDEFRRSVTTKGHHILIRMNGTGKTASGK
jgi:hypothetical protein